MFKAKDAKQMVKVIRGVNEGRVLKIVEDISSKIKVASQFAKDQIKYDLDDKISDYTKQSVVSILQENGYQVDDSILNKLIINWS